MPVLINPAGRYVVIDELTEFDSWLLKPGFRKPTPQQEKTYLEERALRIDEINNPPEAEQDDKRVYLATVTQGSKDGYSIASGALINELKRLGMTAQTHRDNQKVGILFHNPYSITSLENPYKIIMTMFESDKIPDDWKPYLDKADMVIVPSRWCQGVFRKAGVEAIVVPLGYDSRVFQFHEREIKQNVKRPFTFLHYNAFNIRKGFVEVFKAFTEEFDSSEPVRMIFKTTLDQIPLPITREKYPNIEILSGKMTEPDLVELLNRSDCFVFPSRGEGFGMTPLEAMATGMPAIVPNAHGISEYFNPEFMYEVKVKETCPALYSRYKGMDVGKMVVCDVAHLRAQMRYIYTHQEEAMQRGKKASEYVKSWTYERTAIKLKEIIEDALKKIPNGNYNDNNLVLELI